LAESCAVARRNDAICFHLSNLHGIFRQTAIENLAFLIFWQALDNIAQFGFEGIEMPAVADADPHRFAVFVEDDRGANIRALTVQHRELEQQRGAFEMNFKAVVEGAALLIGRAAGGLDKVILIAIAEEAVPEFGESLAHATPAYHVVGHAEEEANEVGVVNV